MPRPDSGSLVGALLFGVTILVLFFVAVPSLRSAAQATPNAALPVPTSPAAKATPDLFFERPWLLDAQTGWLTAQRCVSAPVPSSDQNDNAPPPAPPACKGVIFATEDGGTTWTKQYEGDVLVHTIRFVDRDHGWAVGTSHPQCQDVGCPAALLRTNDGGSHWSAALNAPYSLDQPAFVSATDGWLAGIDCSVRPVGENACAVRLLVTTDGGQTWKESALGSNASPVPGAAVLARPTRKDGWLALSAPRTSTLFVTHDGARTWQALKSPIPVDWPYTLNLTFVDPQRGWLLAGGEPSAGSQGKLLYATTDGGVTWKHLGQSPGPAAPSIATIGPQMSSGYLEPNGLQFLSQSVGWLSLGRFGLLRTTDGGAHWSPITIPSGADGFVAFHLADSQVGWALTPRSLAMTADAGVSWQVVKLPGS